MSCMLLLHWLCSLAHILGRACQACHQVNYIGGLICEVMSEEIGQSSETTAELPRLLESRAEQAWGEIGKNVPYRLEYLGTSQIFIMLWYPHKFVSHLPKF